MKLPALLIIFVATILCGCDEPVTGPPGEVTLKCKLTNKETGLDSTVNCIERTKK
jgi:hypothetical protein